MTTRNLLKAVLLLAWIFPQFAFAQNDVMMQGFYSTQGNNQPVGVGMGRSDQRLLSEGYMV